MSARRAVRIACAVRGACAVILLAVLVRRAIAEEGAAASADTASSAAKVFSAAAAGDDVLVQANPVAPGGDDPATVWARLPRYRHEGVSRVRLSLALTGVGIYDVAFYETLKKPWWSGQKSDFHVINDWWGAYAMEVDKFAHAYAGQCMTRIAAQAYGWTGMTRRQALFWGGVTSLATLTQVELLDGFTAKYGFSTADYAANIAGAFLPLAQDIWQPLQLVTFKMSYHTARFEKGTAPNLLEDYNRQTYWLTLDVNGLLPRPARRYWPDWLQVAAGCGVNHAFEANREREYYLALDVDPTRLPLGDGPLASFLAPFHYLHLPAPAIRFRGDGTKLFALYF